MDNDPEQGCTEFEDFNRDEFVHRNLGDLELCRDVAGIFFAHGSEYIQSIRGALEQLDREAVRQSSHKLKGAAANLALPKVTETASLIEKAAKDNMLENASRLLPELEERLSRAEAAVNLLLQDPARARCALQNPARERTP